MTAEEAQPVQAHLTIHGRVQGVYFRGSLKEHADTRRVTGWVRNLADGSVEALLQGSRPDVDAVIAWARTGPPGAFVESVEVRWGVPAPDVPIGGFDIR
jgi:acylphosphatase